MKRTKRVLGLALAAVMCMGMLAGCGGTKNATNGTETSEKVLNIATIGETTTLSPLYMIADNRPTQKLLYEGLVKYVDGEIQPVLAEDWKLSDDGTQLTFYLRKGVTFHDGEPFNAEAAIANIESWHINPSFTSLPGVVNYTNIEAVDEYTIASRTISSLVNRMPLMKKLSEQQRVRVAMILSWHCQTVMILSLARVVLLYLAAKSNVFRLRGLS